MADQTPVRKPYHGVPPTYTGLVVPAPGRPKPTTDFDMMFRAGVIRRSKGAQS